MTTNPHPDRAQDRGDRPGGSPTIAEIAALTRRLRELSTPGREVDQAERAAFLADKDALIARITDTPTTRPRGRTRADGLAAGAAREALTEAVLARAADDGYVLVGPSARTWRRDPDTGQPTVPATDAEHQTVRELMGRYQLDTTEPQWVAGPNGQDDIHATVVLTPTDTDDTAEVDETGSTDTAGAVDGAAADVGQTDAAVDRGELHSHRVPTDRTGPDAAYSAEHPGWPPTTGPATHDALEHAEGGDWWARARPADGDGPGVTFDRSGFYSDTEIAAIADAMERGDTEQVARLQDRGYDLTDPVPAQGVTVDTARVMVCNPVPGENTGYVGASRRADTAPDIERSAERGATAAAQVEMPGWMREQATDADVATDTGPPMPYSGLAESTEQEQRREQLTRWHTDDNNHDTAGDGDDHPDVTAAGGEGLTVLDDGPGLP